MPAGGSDTSDSVFIGPDVLRYQRILAANGGSADPNALYMMWGGANDIFQLAPQYAANPAAVQAAVAQARADVVAALEGALQPTAVLFKQVSARTALQAAQLS